ncbi:kinase-like domain-containing protein, partial [Glomus cerebriforme]
LCRSINEGQSEACGVMPYMTPEVLRGDQYTKAADIYSFGILMNELMSEEFPHNNIPFDQFLAIDICNGLRPNISEDTPQLIADLIRKCWDAKIENRPTAKELFQTLAKWQVILLNEKDEEDNDEIITFDNFQDAMKFIGENIIVSGNDKDDDSDNKSDSNDEDSEDSYSEEIENIYKNAEYIDDDDDDDFDDSDFTGHVIEISNSITSQIKKCKKIREAKLKNSFSENNSNNIETTTSSQERCTSKSYSFDDLPEPVNLLSDSFDSMRI